ncbi:hypothetical protein BKA62DRAFT_772772 [Auriculariales sp. MPI-PUGE-AT-0066]|nr:hypothetical protein BKA62DRAFT_772772 [Auriculariales sp. MPI-PUGE-AT-0066]
MLTDATVVPAKVLNGFFGPLLIGTWFNLLLLGIEIVQLANYIKLFPSDAVWIRIFISSMVCVDVINTCGVCGLAYACTVLGWGDMTVLNFSNINFSVFAVAMSIGVLMMHTFLILRYYGLSKNLVVSLLLCVPALVACGGGLSISWAAATKFVAASDRPKLRIYVTVVSSGSFGADVCITAAVMYELHRVTTTFERTQRQVPRIVVTSCLTVVV